MIDYWPLFLAWFMTLGVAVLIGMELQRIRFEKHLRRWAFRLGDCCASQFCRQVARNIEDHIEYPEGGM